MCLLSSPALSATLAVPLRIELKEADHLDAARFDNGPTAGG